MHYSDKPRESNYSSLLKLYSLPFIASPHQSDIAPATEGGGLTGPLIYNEETDDKKASPQREPHGATMAGDGGRERGESLIFENQAFMADAGDSVGASSHAQSGDRLTSDTSADRITSDVSVSVCNY